MSAAQCSKAACSSQSEWTLPALWGMRPARAAWYAAWYAVFVSPRLFTTSGDQSADWASFDANSETDHRAVPIVRRQLLWPAGVNEPGRCDEESGQGFQAFLFSFNFSGAAGPLAGRACFVR